ncbi:Aste57867_9137 [Aphanomyces stellatus]|uniref:Aste57867_9137 protein n=1 Tax=Aphanomyces stellatus TaxID=120398 RepID=A0A485KMG4_9STRA|nr:hypothetical protein As57867_009101 [Aphanomyces stellatus]VFT86021.1 Aste57867_9137 [Aphanomyces stellatus]
MGSNVATFLHVPDSIKKRRIILVGLDAAGKTTILYQLKLGTRVQTISTIGFNVETVRHKGVEFTVWDLFSQEKARPLWRYYFAGTDAVVFVVDANDRDRMELATDELHRMFDNDDLRDAKLLVYANKQDLSGAMWPADVADAMRLPAFTARKREWIIQPCSAVTGEGIELALTYRAHKLPAWDDCRTQRNSPRRTSSTGHSSLSALYEEPTIRKATSRRGSAHEMDDDEGRHGTRSPRGNIQRVVGSITELFKRVPQSYAIVSTVLLKMIASIDSSRTTSVVVDCMCLGRTTTVELKANILVPSPRRGIHRVNVQHDSRGKVTIGHELATEGGRVGAGDATTAGRSRCEHVCEADDARARPAYGRGVAGKG